MSIDDEIKKPKVAAAAGAVAALIAATYVPAGVILVAGALTAGGLYVFGRKLKAGFGKKDKGEPAPAGETIDAEPIKDGEEK